MTRLTRAVPVALALLVAASWPAGAQSPDRTGWWSTTSVGGTVLPLPALPTTTPADGLHIANGPTGMLAFAAVSYHPEPFSTATLVLHLTASSLVGTPLVQACPTTTDTWPSGGNQAAASAPAFSCAGRSTPGLLGTDSTGKILTFLLDATQQSGPGVVSLAIVPLASSTAPFSFDLAKPTTSSFVGTPVRQAPAAVPATAAAPVAASPQPAAVSPVAELPGGPVITDLPVPAEPSVPVPAIAPAPAAASPAPVDQLQVAEPRLVPTAARVGLRSDERARQASLLLLAALIGGLGYLIGHNQDVPLRLIGGRAVRPTPGDLLLADADAPVGGLGRFARPRPTAARKLT